jgi:hypothetical protein
MTKPQLVLTLALLAGAWTGAPAAPDNAGPPAGDAAADAKPKILSPMRAKEPMPGEMKRNGMLKEDVRNQAMKKDAMMRDAMKKEEMKK